jgi:tetratricopeptide (TPR) repeat protein
LSQLDQPAKLAVLLRARGLVAEGLRGSVAQGGLDRLAESIGGAHTRVQPGLRRVGEAVLNDDRSTNTLQLQLNFELADPGEYEPGVLQMEFNAIELTDMLSGPAEQQRRTPFLIDQPALATSRVEVLTPQPMLARPPAPTEVADRHFRLAISTQIEGQRLSLLRRYERRTDEVLPADLPAFRENLLKARQLLGNRLRLALLEQTTVEGLLSPLERRVRSSPGFRDDNAARLQMRQELAFALDSQILLRTGNDGPLAQRVRADRAQNANLLGHFDSGLSDAEWVLKKDAASAAALEARAVALVGLGRLDDSLPAFEALAAAGKRTAAQHWMGAVQLTLGRAAAAEALFREVVASSGGDEREFALLWLFLSAERQAPGRGREAIAGFVGSADAKKLTGALLLHFDGQLSRDALMKVVAERREMARLNEAEAHFYLGQWAKALGQADEAQRAFRQVLATGVVMYRETTFARLELQRSAAAR